MGSSTPGDSDKFYIPLAVQEGWEISVVNYYRQKFGIFRVDKFSTLTDADGNHFPPKLEDSKSNLVEMILQPLDTKTGETIRDPVPVGINLRLRQDLEAGLRNL